MREGEVVIMDDSTGNRAWRRKVRALAAKGFITIKTPEEAAKENANK